MDTLAGSGVLRVFPHNEGKLKMAKSTDTRTVQERKNSGYHDGVAARGRNRWPLWGKGTIFRNRHPFDKPYGEGFWIGWYDEEPPKGAVIG